MIEVIRALLLSDELDIERAAGQYEALLQEQRNNGEAEAQRAELNREIEKLSKQKTRLVQMNLDGAITDAELVELMRETARCWMRMRSGCRRCPSPRRARRTSARW